MLFIILYKRTINSIIRAECKFFLPRAGLYFHNRQKTKITHFAIFAVETALSRKLNRITPLRHVLDLLTLVDLMNQFRGVIDQTHVPLSRTRFAPTFSKPFSDPASAKRLLLPPKKASCQQVHKVL